VTALEDGKPYIFIGADHGIRPSRRDRQEDRKGKQTQYTTLSLFQRFFSRERRQLSLTRLRMAVCFIRHKKLANALKFLMLSELCAARATG